LGDNCCGVDQYCDIDTKKCAPVLTICKSFLIMHQLYPNPEDNPNKFSDGLYTIMLMAAEHQRDLMSASDECDFVSYDVIEVANWNALGVHLYEVADLIRETKKLYRIKYFAEGHGTPEIGENLFKLCLDFSSSYSCPVFMDCGSSCLMTANTNEMEQHARSVLETCGIPQNARVEFRGNQRVGVGYYSPEMTFSYIEHDTPKIIELTPAGFSNTPGMFCDEFSCVYPEILSSGIENEDYFVNCIDRNTNEEKTIFCCMTQEVIGNDLSIFHTRVETSGCPVSLDDESVARNYCNRELSRTCGGEVLGDNEGCCIYTENGGVIHQKYSFLTQKCIVCEEGGKVYPMRDQFDQPIFYACTSQQKIPFLRTQLFSQSPLHKEEYASFSYCNVDPFLVSEINGDTFRAFRCDSTCNNAVPYLESEVTPDKTEIFTCDPTCNSGLPFTKVLRLFGLPTEHWGCVPGCNGNLPFIKELDDGFNGMIYTQECIPRCNGRQPFYTYRFHNGQFRNYRCNWFGRIVEV
jgi:hypothetical protein